MVIRAATDVGGTFTDLAYYNVDSETGRCGVVHTAKVDTTPPNFEQGVLRSLAKGGITPTQIGFFAHGATVVINAITERKGARVGLITTRGFRDVLEIARGNRPDLFNFNFRKPPPLVERHLRRELTERCNYKGEIEIEAELAELDGILEQFRTEQVEAIAICLLHAYRNPANERLVAAAVRKSWPGVSVVASHELIREWREYERTSTTVLSAYVQPATQRYIESLARELKSAGVPRPPYMMLSNGGIATVATATRNPVAMVESGPAGGIHAAAHLGDLIGARNLIVLDIGGTTAKCTLIENGAIRILTSYYVERTRRSPGYPIQTAVPDIVEIGNGGGSIAWLDPGGKLHVGPQSAGAIPGPVAYGRGGRAPTTTDANLLLGRIDPESLAGGALQPAREDVHRAFEDLGRKLGVSAIEAARGVIRIANANMANALRRISTNQGHDPREFALMAFGGGGPMHAVALARELKVPEVIVPVNSAVFSAWGMLLTDLRRDYVQTNLMTLEPDAADRIVSLFRAIESEAASAFTSEGIETGALVCDYLLDMRYEEQEHTVKIPVGMTGQALDVARIAELFHTEHAKRYTYRLSSPVQIVNFHVVARVPVSKPELPKRHPTGRTVEQSVCGQRMVDFDGDGVHQATIYDGRLLEPGMELFGPAIVQEPVVTLVVPPGNCITIDEYGSYHVHVS